MPNELKQLVSEINIYIESGNKAWREIAKRLTRIHKDGLWCPAHKSFRAFVRAEWGREKSWAYHLMDSESALQQLEENSQTNPSSALDASEGAARALSRVPTEKRAKVVVEAAKSGSVTAKSVAEAAKVVLKPAKEEDDMGTVIPESALPIWNRRGEIKELMTQASKLKCAIEKAVNSGDTLLSNIGQNCLAKMQMVYHELASAYPEVLCGTCEGRVPRTGCGTCSSTGFQSKQHYNTLTPREDVGIRKAAIELRRKDAATRLSTTMPRLNP